MLRRWRTTIALLATLAVALQLPLTAYAAHGDSQCVSAAHALGAHAVTAGDPCCPSGATAANCCLGVCAAVAVITAAPVRLYSYAPTEAPPSLESPELLTRADAPLIRPPIS